MDRTSLTADGQLVLHSLPRVRELVRRWLPRTVRLGETVAGAVPAAHITVRDAGESTGSNAWEPPVGDAVMTLGSIRGFDLGDDRLQLRFAAGGSVARLRLAERVAEVEVGDAERDAHLEAVLALCAALLLGRLGRALVHAAAVLDPSGRAWLLAGDSHSGKTSTCATLLEGGWRYCSDDQVVLSRAGAGAEGGIRVEGWPRLFHLDAGYRSGGGAPTGVRCDVDADARWPGRRERGAALAGVLLPRVEDGAPTALEEGNGADRLQELVRQSPWLFVDTGMAGSTLALLRDAASTGGARLRLGRDSYGRPAILRAVLEPLIRR